MSTSMREKKLAFTKDVIAEMTHQLAAVTNRREADELRATFEATLVFDRRMVKGMALEPEIWDEVAPALEQLRAEIRRKSPTPARPAIPWRVGFVCPASASNFETSENITDWTILELFEGVTPWTLFELDALDDLSDVQILDVSGAFRARDGKLVFEFLVGLPREPTEREIRQIAEGLDAMLASRWGWNLEWNSPEDERLDELRPFVEGGFVLDPTTMSPATFRN